MRQVQEWPESAPKIVGSNTRELMVRFGHYGYIIRYTIEDDRVIVTRIFHGREKR
jgi:plasmid stabilization system protein ParE